MLLWVKSVAFAPVIVTPEIVIFAVPEFVSVMVCGELLVPMACCPKAKAFGVIRAAGN